MKQLNPTNSLCFKIEVIQSIKTGYKSCQPFVSKQQHKAKTQSIEEQPLLEGHEHLQVKGTETFQSSCNDELLLQNEITHQETVVRTTRNFHDSSLDLFNFFLHIGKMSIYTIG